MHTDKVIFTLPAACHGVTSIDLHDLGLTDFVRDFDPLNKFSVTVDAVALLEDYRADLSQ